VEFLQSSLPATPSVSLSMPKMKEVMAKYVALGDPIEHHGIFTRLLEAAFFTSARLAGSMDSIPMKIHLPPAARSDQRAPIPQQIGSDLGTQCTCAFAGNNVSRAMFCALYVMQNVVDENTAIWPPSSARALSAAEVRSPRLHWYESGWSRQKTTVTVPKLASVRQPRRTTTE